MLLVFFYDSQCIYNTIQHAIYRAPWSHSFRGAGRQVETVSQKLSKELQTEDAVHIYLTETAEFSDSLLLGVVHKFTYLFVRV